MQRLHRPVQIIIPFRYENAKSRLASVLSPEERREFAQVMLRDVLKAVLQVTDSRSVTILSRPGFKELEPDLGVDIAESDLGLNDALNSSIEDWNSEGWTADLLIVMADLALLTKDDLLGIMKTAGDVVLSPGHGGGTNMILIRRPEFRTCYVGISYPKHLDFCRNHGLTAGIYASYHASCDIDTSSEIIEVLIHNRGRTKAFLKKLGFTVTEDGRTQRIVNQR